MKLSKDRLNLLAIVAFVVSLSGWGLTRLEIVDSHSPLAWVIAGAGLVLVVAYLVAFIRSRWSS